MDEEPRLRNPFRNEPDAFRLLVIIGISILVIVVAAALGGAVLGVPVALLLFAAATRATFRWLRQALQERDEEADPEASGVDADDELAASDGQ